MSPTNSEFQKDGKQFIITTPSKENRPKSNDEAMQRFGEPITAMVNKLNLAKATKDEDAAKKIRRNLRKLGYTLAGNRTRGIMTVEI